MEFSKTGNISVNCVVLTLCESGFEVLPCENKLKLLDATLPDNNDWFLMGVQNLNSEKSDNATDGIFEQVLKYKTPFKKNFKINGIPERINNHQSILLLHNSGLKHYIISVVYNYYYLVAKVLTIVEEVQWFLMNNFPVLERENGKIIHQVIQNTKLRDIFTPIIFHLQQDKFILNNLDFVYEALLYIEINSRKFRKNTLNKPNIMLLDRKCALKGAERSAALNMFAQNIYKKLGEENQVNYSNFSLHIEAA